MIRNGIDPANPESHVPQRDHGIALVVLYSNAIAIQSSRRESGPASLCRRVHDLSAAASSAQSRVARSVDCDFSDSVEFAIAVCQVAVRPRRIHRDESVTESIG